MRRSVRPRRLAPEGVNRRKRLDSQGFREPTRASAKRLQSGQVTPMGSELSRFPSGKPDVSKSGGSKSGNKGADRRSAMIPTRPTDAELAAVIAAWPNLPLAIRAGVLALVRAAGGGQ